MRAFLPEGKGFLETYEMLSAWAAENLRKELPVEEVVGGARLIAEEIGGKGQQRAAVLVENGRTYFTDSENGEPNYEWPVYLLAQEGDLRKVCVSFYGADRRAAAAVAVGAENIAKLPYDKGVLASDGMYDIRVSESGCTDDPLINVSFSHFSGDSAPMEKALMDALGNLNRYRLGKKS